MSEDREITARLQAITQRAQRASMQNRSANYVPDVTFLRERMEFWEGRYRMVLAAIGEMALNDRGVCVRVDLSELQALMSPQQIAALLGGVAQVIAANAGTRSAMWPSARSSSGSQR